MAYRHINMNAKQQKSKQPVISFLYSAIGNSLPIGVPTVVGKRRKKRIEKKKKKKSLVRSDRCILFFLRRKKGRGKKNYSK